MKKRNLLRLCGELNTAVVTIMEGITEDGKPGQNPEQLGIETFQASWVETAHIVHCGGGGDGNAPMNNLLS